MTKSRWIGVIAALLVLGVTTCFLAVPHDARLAQAATWQQLAAPGRLSAAHAFLNDNCAACHTSVRGVEAVNCTACHANNESLLQRQPTGFHADVSSCRECHPEHQGGKRPPTTMDHATLSRIGLRMLGDQDHAQAERGLIRQQLLTWIDRQESDSGTTSPHERITPIEATLNCAACHSNKDRHFKLFGQDCAQCHATTQWTIPGFRHPSPRSTDCAQCHQAPPSHYMGHFNMVCKKVAGKPNAQVNQCQLCHQTTAWNDIKGVGFYKHH